MASLAVLVLTHYADLVRPHLTVEVEEHPGGLFHSFGEMPLNRRRVAELLPEGHPWLPPELTVLAQLNKDTTPTAEQIPERLTRMLVPPPEPDSPRSARAR